MRQSLLNAFENPLNEMNSKCTNFTDGNNIGFSFETEPNYFVSHSKIILYKCIKKIILNTAVYGMIETPAWQMLLMNPYLIHSYSNGKGTVPSSYCLQFNLWLVILLIAKHKRWFSDSFSVSFFFPSFFLCHLVSFNSIHPIRLNTYSNSK